MNFRSIYEAYYEDARVLAPWNTMNAFGGACWSAMGHEMLPQWAWYLVMVATAFFALTGVIGWKARFRLDREIIDGLRELKASRAEILRQLEQR